MVKPRPDQFVVIVKRLGPTSIPRGGRVIYDMVDIWAKGSDADAGPEEIGPRVRAYARAYHSHAVVYPTEQAYRELHPYVNTQAAFIVRHHYRPGAAPVKLREEPRAIVYEGSRKYLGDWQAKLQTLASRMNLLFLINPPSITDGDIVVAARQGRWGGAAADAYKPGVKFANALGFGLPAVLPDECGYMEMAPDRPEWFYPRGKFDEMADRIRALLPLDARLARVAEQEKYRAAYSLKAIADGYAEEIARL